jgi:hypothetical protein
MITLYALETRMMATVYIRMLSCSLPLSISLHLRPFYQCHLPFLEQPSCSLLERLAASLFTEITITSNIECASDQPCTSLIDSEKASQLSRKCENIKQTGL